MVADGAFHRSSPDGAVVVVGGGIGGMRAALDLADAGLRVYLVEQTPCLGGRVAQLGYMFPQHDCVLCRGTPDHGYGCTRPSISPAYIHQNQHPNITILTQTHVMAVEGQAGDFTVTLRSDPRYVDVARCIDCGLCEAVCPVELPDAYQQGLTTQRAIHKVAARAAPDAYIIEWGAYCTDCGQCVAICPTEAIDLDEQPRLVTVGAAAIILALGFEVFDAGALEELGMGRFPNVLSAMQYERMASRSGPTEGVLTRPTDGQPPQSIAWLQCIGSRDTEHPYCSSICCMYATKEAMLAKQRLGAAVDCAVFIMDERAFNKEYSTYFARARQDYGIRYIRSRVSAIHHDPATQNLILNYGDASGQLCQEEAEMVVLATGLQPPASARQLSDVLGIELNDHGFCHTDKFTPLQTTRPGVFVCGAFSSPKEIAETIIDASGAAAEVMRLLSTQLNTQPFTREWPFLAGNDLPPERDVSHEPVRVGVFVCSCGKTLNPALDLVALRQFAAALPGVVLAGALDLACLPADRDQLQVSIAEHDLNRVVIAACSNRTHEALFQREIRRAGLNPFLLEMVNLREQCSRVHVAEPDLANRKARELVRVAVGRAAAATAVHKDRHRCRPTALVIGGGVSGMTTALAIADSGGHVHLVERAEMLGGNLLHLHYVAEGYQPQRLLRDLVNRVRAHQRITTYLRTDVKRHWGHVGYFRAVLRTRQADGTLNEQAIEHGVTVVATGGHELDTHPLLAHPQVITQTALEELIIHDPQQIAALHDVVMINCVRPEGVADYCSRVCCTNSLKNAMRIKLFNPGCRVTILNKNIVTYGFREQYYTEARRLGVVFVRYADDLPPEVIQDGDRLRVRVRDQALNRWLELPADLVPLAMTIGPAEGTRQLADILRVPLSSEGFFAEAQIKLRPMDFMREGIFLAGMAHYPKFVEESISHAMAAAARALPLLSQQSLHLGGIVARVDAEKCVGCLTCTRVCPFEIPQVVEEAGRTGVGGLGGAAFIDAAQCQGCGTCTGECPANAIQLVHYTDDQIMLQPIGGLGSWSTSMPGEVVL